VKLSYSKEDILVIIDELENDLQRLRDIVNSERVAVRGVTEGFATHVLKLVQAVAVFSAERWGDN
jgi:hypothetical protein